MIPKGTTVILNSTFQHETEGSPCWTGDEAVSSRLDNLRSGEARKVGYWQDGTGKAFEPERWIKDGQFDGNAGPSIPFGAGQRGCFGRNLAVSNSDYRS